MNTDNRLSFGPSLENIVYLYLASHDYQLSIGKIGKLECDFIVRKKMEIMLIFKLLILCKVKI